MSAIHPNPQDNVPEHDQQPPPQTPPFVNPPFGSPLTPLPPSRQPTAVPPSTGGSVFRDPPPGSPPVELPPQVPPQVPPKSPVAEGQAALSTFNNDLAAALVGLTSVIQRNNAPTSSPGPSSRSKAKEPDTFYGNEPNKLRSFLMQCSLNFVDRPQDFQTDKQKVIFSLSHLRGIAGSWFEPDMAGLPEREPPWFNNYADFVATLRLNFGPLDPTADAEAGIAKLKMRDSQKIATYLVEFNALATILDWNDAALRHHFYNGLPGRLKDEVSRDGKPTDLNRMRIKAQLCDARHWERRAEITRESTMGHPSRPPFEPRPSSSSPAHAHRQQPTKPPYKKHSDNRPSFQPTHSSSQAPPAYRPSTSGPPAHSSKPKEDLSKKLGKDGKLTPAERQRRIDAGTCLWCDKPGHKANVCPLNTTKARMAKADSAAESPTGTSAQEKA